MNSMVDKKSSWRGEPMVWLLIALPLSAVLASAVTIWIANHNADTLVKEEYVKEGFAIRQASERDRLAADLGLSAKLNVLPGGLSLDLTGHLNPMPESLALTLAHPTDPNQDLVLSLQSVRDGQYTAQYADIPSGKRHLELAPLDKSWRLAGRWQGPLEGPMLLNPMAQGQTPSHSSTRP